MSNPTYFEKVKPVWDELATLLAKARRRGPRGLTADELARLDRLYRLTTIHLAQARLRTTNRALIERLNRLVAQAHSLIYVSPKRNPLRRIVEFYLTGFSRAVARTWRFHVAALLLFAVAAFVTYEVARFDDTAVYAVMAGDVRLPGSSAEQLENVLRHGREEDPEGKFIFASFLFTHNTKVGLFAFTSGILAAVPTVFAMLQTGAMMGAFAAVHNRRGVGTEMWAWILPHGITEIGAVILCGGAGLMLGMALLRPGHTTRARSLVAAGKEAIRLAMGILPMFLFAGVIESYLRQSHLSTAARLEFAAGTFVFWVLYFAVGYLREAHAGHATESDPPASRTFRTDL